MRPLTYTRPKVMLPIANRPILEHALLEGVKAGIEEYIFVIGYYGDTVRGYFGSGERWGVKIDYVTQREQLGTANALDVAKELLDGSFIVLNGDVVVQADDIARVAAGGSTTMSVIEVQNPAHLGVVRVDGDRVVAIYEKVAEPPTNLVNAGLYLLTADIFAAVSRTKRSPRGEYEITDSLELMIEEGQAIRCQHLDSWLDLTYPWQLLDANEAMLAGLEPQSQGDVEEGVVIRGPVSIGKGTVVRSGSYLEGPIVIGDGCRIGPHCYIRPATAIGDGCHIGSAVEVKNCIIMRGTNIPHHNYVGDSVIGEGCNLGAGTKVANLRLDREDVMVGNIDSGRRKLGAIIGDDVEVGINAAIDVGSLVGNGTWIAPGAVAGGILLPDSRVF